MKIRKLISVFVLIVIVVNIETIIADLNTDEDFYTNKHIAKTSDINFGEISGGVGLTVEICNKGDYDVENVKLSVEVKGFLGVVPKKQFDVGMIQSNNSTKVDISVYGFAFGLIADLPSFILTISSPDMTSLTGSVTARVRGNLVKIVSIAWNSNLVSDGYILFSPVYSGATYLINNDGNIVHSWRSIYTDSQAVYLLENGNLMRSSMVYLPPTFFFGGAQGRFQMFDQDGKLIWWYRFANDMHRAHHDFEILPNGNILIINWEKKTVDEALASGRNSNNLSLPIYPDYIMEIKPIGRNDIEVVWEWHVWDHLIQDFDPTKDNYGVVADHPELIDINFQKEMSDFTHINSVDYHEEFDQILLSVKHYSEIWVIDHSTTTEEAAGHTGGNSGKGGDLLYRWGNPQAYDMGNESNQKFSYQHQARWIEKGCPGEGNIILFNNGGGYQVNGSSIDEFVPPVDENGSYYLEPGSAYGPEERIWIFTTEDPWDLAAPIGSSAQRMQNGNTLICCYFSGVFIEVTYEKEIIWQYFSQYPRFWWRRDIADIIKYDSEYPAFDNIFK